MREAFETEAAKTGRSRLLITAAVPAGKIRIDGGYEVDVLSR